MLDVWKIEITITTEKWTKYKTSDIIVKFVHNSCDKTFQCSQELRWNFSIYAGTFPFAKLRWVGSTSMHILGDDCFLQLLLFPFGNIWQNANLLCKYLNSTRTLRYENAKHLDTFEGKGSRNYHIAKQLNVDRYRLLNAEGRTTTMLSLYDGQGTNANERKRISAMLTQNTRH